MKIKVWLDSGANIHSRREWEIEFDADEWNEMTDDERTEMMREIAFERLDWGFGPTTS